MDEETRTSNPLTQSLPVSSTKSIDGDESGSGTNTNKFRDGLAILWLEQSFVRVPFEQLNKSARSCQRTLEKDLPQVVSSVEKIEQQTQSGKMSSQEAYNEVSTLITRLQGLKRKLSENKKNEEEQIVRVRSRLDHMKLISAKKVTNDNVWFQYNQTRLDRLIVDYLSREGYFQTARALCQSHSLHKYVDIGLFEECYKIEESLSVAHDCSLALSWAAENRSKLRKIKSSFEFNMRVQVFVEHVRANQLQEAINYARKYLTPLVQALNASNPELMKELQVVMSLLVFLKHTTCPRYKKYFSLERWTELSSQFVSEFYEVYNLSAESQLTIHLRAGLSALKTNQCGSASSSRLSCPVCEPTMFALSRSLPYAQFIHSALLCPLSGSLMDSDNPPLVLPNGYVYSTNALNKMADENNGMIKCPKTGFICRKEQLRRAFIS